MTIHSITFVHPVWLLVGLLFAVAILILGARLDRKRRLALAAFSSRRNGAASSLSRTRRGFKRALLVAGALLGCATLARPQWGVRWEEAQRRGLDLLFALDTSKSMLAPDLKPDRLTRAKLAIRDLVAKFDGDRVGLVAFAGDAFLQCPLTPRSGRLRADPRCAGHHDNFSRRHRRGPGHRRCSFGAAQPARKSQALGVPHRRRRSREPRGPEGSRGGRRRHSHLHRWRRNAGRRADSRSRAEPGQFARDDKGGFVRSQLDENTLQAIARVTGGDYRRLGVDGRGLEALYQDVLAKLPREDLHSRMHQIPIERFQWPLGFSILCLALEPLLGERRRRRVFEAEPEKRWPKLALLRRRVVVTLVMVAATAVAQSANASPRDAERAYHEGKFKQSAEEYGRALARAPNDVKLQYNLGVASYKSGEFAKAGDALGRSLHSDRLDLQENAYYDLGNVLFRVGQETVAKQPEQTTEKWKKAIASYESALKLNPKDQDAIYNRDLVKRRLAALEQQQQKQRDEQKKKEDKSGQQNKQNQAGKQGQKDQQAKNEQGNQQKQQGQQNKQEPQNSQNEKGQPKDQNQQGSAQPQQGTGQPKPAAAKPEQHAPGAASASDESEKDQKEHEVPGKLSKNDAKELLDAVRGDEKIMPMVPAGPNRLAPDDVVRKDW